MNKFRNLGVLCVAFLTVACGSDGDPGVPVVYEPTTADISFPNDLLLLTSTDGTLDIPVVDPDDRSDPGVALSGVDGFSTISPIVVGVEEAVDSGSIVVGETVRLFEMTFDPRLGAATGIDSQVPSNQYTAIAQGESIVVMPLRPLKPRTSYLVMLTDGLRTVTGRSLRRSADFRLMMRTRPLVNAQGKSTVPGRSDAEAGLLEQIRGLNILQVQFAAGVAGIAPRNVIQSWSFRTQSISEVLEAVFANSPAAPFGSVFAGVNTGELGLGLPGLADVHVGTIDVPFYLDRADPLQGIWQGVAGSNITQFNAMPVATETISLPVFITIPNEDSGQEKPEDGWPVIIYQHGITRMRIDSLAVADTWAAAGYVVIAIDMPMHGVDDETSPFYMGGLERTFDLDLINNTTGAPGGDMIIDPSGTHFVTLSSLQTIRDNFRQGAADLFSLVSTIPTMDFDGGGADTDATRIHLFAHSLGAMMGINVLAIDDRIGASVLAMPGAGIARLFEASASFGPVLEAGLAAQGVFPGTPEYDQFFTVAQTVLDSVDPINTGAIAAGKHPIYLMEIVGSSTSLPDQTMPNVAPPWPLAGTEPLAAIMGLVPITGTLNDAGGVRGIVRYTSGEHSAFLEPGNSPLITPEILGATIVFFDSAGQSAALLNPDTIK